MESGSLPVGKGIRGIFRTFFLFNCSSLDGVSQIRLSRMSGIMQALSPFKSHLSTLLEIIQTMVKDIFLNLVLVFIIIYFIIINQIFLKCCDGDIKSHLCNNGN